MRATTSLILAAVAAVFVGAMPPDSTRAAGRDDVLRVLADYRAAMSARSVAALSKTVAPDLTVAEGTLVNRGWADYRDHHIGPEMKEWTSYKTEGVQTESLEISDRTAYVVQRSTITVGEEKGQVVLDAVETFVLRRYAGAWSLRHVHFSGKRRP